MELSDWRSQVGKVKLEQSTWSSQLGAVNLEQSTWSSQGGVVNMEQSNWRRQVGAVKLEQIGAVKLELLRGQSSLEPLCYSEAKEAAQFELSR